MAEDNPSNPSPADDLKRQGNDAFVAKDYQKAIELYGEAIKLEPENAVYYSNRSACYAALKQWQKSYDDALLSVKKDPKFIKGYYRLSSAQAELQLYDDAETTLKQALLLEPGNEVITRQIKALKTKKANAAAVAQQAKRAPTRKLDEAQIKELMELQEQIGTYSKDLRIVKTKLAGLQRESRVNAVTTHHIQSLVETAPLYRSVGKAFVHVTKAQMEERLDKEIGELTKAQRDLTDRQEYLERRISSATENLKDLYGQN